MRVSSRLAVVALIAFAFSPHSRADGADLRHLLPPETGAVLTVEDLQDHAREVLASPFADAVARLPAIRGWLQSESFAAFRKARGDIEGALGVDLATARDELLGEWVAFAMVPAADDVHGLFLSRFRNRATLDRLLAALNGAEIRDGTQLEVAERRDRQRSPYWHRRFRPGTKPDEWYAILPGDVFAWSNSEPQILAVMARAAIAITNAKPAPEPGLPALREGLPSRAVARLFVDPRFLERVLNFGEAGGTPWECAARDYLASLKSVGAALAWRDGLVLHVRQTFGEGDGPPPVRVLAPRAPVQPLPVRIPETAVAVLAVRIDVVLACERMMEAVPEAEKARVEAGLIALRGIFLGKDLVAEILPAVGPELRAVVEPGGDGRLEAVLAVRLDENAEVRAAFGNALRTVWALLALNPDGPNAGGRLETRDRSGVAITTILGASREWSFAARAGLVAFGTNPDALSAFLANPGGGMSSAFEALRRDQFPDASTFAIADLEALERIGRARRDAIVTAWSLGRGERPEDVGRDFDKALDLLGLVRLGYASTTIADDGRSSHQTLGFQAREAAKRP